MNEHLFRKKSIDRISSPEQLDTYIRVANPGIWMVLAAIVVLLVGVCVWRILGRLDTTVSAVAVCEEGTVSLYVKEGTHTSVQTDMEVQIEEERCVVTEISAISVAAGEKLSDYALHVGGFDSDDWVYIVRTDEQLSDSVKGYRFEPDDLKTHGKFPCIIHWNFNHFVVLNGFKGDKAVLNDPAKQRKRNDDDIFSETFVGIADAVLGSRLPGNAGKWLAPGCHRCHADHPKGRWHRDGADSQRPQRLCVL